MTGHCISFTRLGGRQLTRTRVSRWPAAARHRVDTDLGGSAAAASPIRELSARHANRPHHDGRGRSSRCSSNCHRSRRVSPMPVRRCSCTEDAVQTPNQRVTRYRRDSNQSPKAGSLASPVSTAALKSPAVSARE